MKKSVFSLLFVASFLAVIIMSGYPVQGATAINRLSLGTNIDFDATLIAPQLVSEANLKFIRLFDFRVTSPNIAPCISWNDDTRTGTWNWTNMDKLVEQIFNAGAEPFLSLGSARDADSISDYIPLGMPLDSYTLLPYPESWAAYCREWVKHFKQTGKQVRYYETMNEPWMYFGRNNYVKLGNFMEVFNAAAAAMRAENPNVLVSFDSTDRKAVLNYWLANGGADLDFISFHKYDSGTIGQYSDAELLNRAETHHISATGTYYGVKGARQAYYNARGKWLPVMNTEAGLNSAFADGTDPKIQQMVGAVDVALTLRIEMLEGVDCHLYYDYVSSKSWELSSKTSGGWGFGMVNEDDNQPYYPYYVMKLIGANLAVGDEIISETANGDIRTVSWRHNGVLKTLVISKSSVQQTVNIDNVGKVFAVEKIDDAVLGIQTSTLSPSSSLSLNGLSVALLTENTEIPTHTPTPTPNTTLLPTATPASASGDFQTALAVVSAVITAGVGICLLAYFKERKRTS